MVKPGRPLETWTSTETARPMAPLSVAEAIVASTRGTVAPLRPAHRLGDVAAVTWKDVGALRPARRATSGVIGERKSGALP